MPMSDPVPVEVDAARGEKTIEFSVRLWTNGIAESGIRPKHAKSGGTVQIVANKAHGIHPRKPSTFNTLAELQTKLEALLIEHKIKLHPFKATRRYMATK